MKSLLVHYGSRLLLAVLITFLLFNFGNPFVFDRLLLATLIVVSVVTFPFNKNSFSILVLASCELIFEEINWLIFQDSILGAVNQDSLLLKIYCYSICLLGCYLERDEKISNLVFLVFTIAVSFEVYWYLGGYTSKPIYWFILTSGQLLVFKHILLLRPHILCRRYPNIKDWTWSVLDMDYMVFLRLRLLLESAMILEYLVRYSTDNPELLYVYNAYSYIAQLINCYLLISVFVDSKNTFASKFINA